LFKLNHLEEALDSLEEAEKTFSTEGSDFVKLMFTTHANRLRKKIQDALDPDQSLSTTYLPFPSEPLDGGQSNLKELSSSLQVVVEKKSAKNSPGNDTFKVGAQKLLFYQ